jgi:23S rRNA pseudouridine955/2504/2580 synthase
MCTYQGMHLDAWMHCILADATVAVAQKPRLVHRLDRETSGCLIIAKTREMAATLAAAFKAGRVQKCYVALVAGHIAHKRGG